MNAKPIRYQCRHCGWCTEAWSPEQASEKLNTVHTCSSPLRRHECKRLAPTRVKDDSPDLNKFFDWEICSGGSVKPSVVGEFVRLDGTLPSDLKGKSLDEIACITVVPGPCTFKARAKGRVALGETATVGGKTFRITSIEAEWVSGVEIMQTDGIR